MQKMKLSTAIGHGIGTLGESIGYNMFYSFFLFFLNTIVGISPAVAGAISMLSVLWDAITDPLVGYLSDNSRNPRGRRRPWMFKWSFALGLTIFMMFSEVPFSPDVKGLYYLAMNMLFWLFMTMTDIPYLALGAEISTTSEERTTIRTISSMFYFGGNIFASSITLALVAHFSIESAAQGWGTTAAIMGSATTLFFLISWLATKGKEPQNINLSKPVEEKKPFVKSFLNVVRSYVEICKIGPFTRILVFSYVVRTSGNVMTASLMYFCTYNSQMTQGEISTMYMVSSIVQVVLSLVLGALSNKIGKKKTAIICNTITGLSLLVMGVSLAWGITYIYIYTIAIAIGMSGFFVVIYSMIYDVADLDELENNERRDGAMQALFQLSIKFSTATGMFLSGLLLSFYKFDETLAVQTAETLQGIENLVIFVPGIGFLIGALIIMKYPLTPEKMREITKRREKKAGLAKVE